MLKVIVAAAGLAVAANATARTGLESVASEGFSGLTYVNGQGIAGKSYMQSARNGAPGTRDASGDDYTAAVLAQSDAGGAFFIDDFPDDFVFGTNPQDSGANLITGAGTNKVDFETILGPGMKAIQVNHFTTDSSEYIPAGIDPVGDGAGTLTAIRFDVGGFAAGSEFGAGTPDPIEWNGTTFTVVSAEIALFIDGALVFTAPTAADDFSAGLASAGVVGGADGSGVDEVAIVWVLNEVPAPGAVSLFGLAGLAAVRRRR